MCWFLNNYIIKFNFYNFNVNQLIFNLIFYLILIQWLQHYTTGIPATLNYIPLDVNQGVSPKLIPYPNWSQNRAGACGSGLTTVYR